VAGLSSGRTLRRYPYSNHWGCVCLVEASARRTADDNAIYDACLVGQSGNTVLCDALKRMVERERIKQQIETYLAAGFTKREVVQWATERGFTGKQLSDALGISLQDLQTGNY
jgi:hypothetical protein